MSDTGYPIVQPGKAVASLPAISAENYAHVGRYAGAMVISCFQSIGGLERFASWANSNPTDFFTKIMPKVIQKTQQVDISGTVNIDDAISRLQAIEGEVLDKDLKEREWDL